MKLQRLDKIISDATSFSRKDVKGLIKAGRVTINGKIANSSEEKVDADTVEIVVSGEKINFCENHYFMMNKPAGYVSATEDVREKTVLELLKKEDKHLKLFPAGRLDKDAEGLLLLTDDGDFCHNVISPKKQIFKVYYVETEGKLTAEDAEAFEKGIILTDGLKCLPGHLEILKSDVESEAYVSICEGKFHQVKRMLASLGKPVKYLKRVKIGNLELDMQLEKGRYRELKKEEISKIFGNFQ